MYSNYRQFAPYFKADGFSVELLQEELASMKKKWYEFGQKLGLSDAQLHSFEHTTGQDAEYYFSQLLAQLVEVESEVKLSWGRIVDAVKELGDGTLATELAEKYGMSESLRG